MDDRNHQAFGHGAGLRSFAPQMGCRTYFRMARSLSQTGKGFRSDNRQRRCLGIRRPHPNPHPATRKNLRSNAIIMSRTLRPLLPRTHENQLSEGCPRAPDGLEQTGSPELIPGPRIRSYDARPAPLIFRQKKASPPGVDGNFELAGDAERAGPSLDRGFLSGDAAGDDLLRVGHGSAFGLVGWPAVRSRMPSRRCSRSSCLNVSLRGFAGFPARIRCIQILTLSRSASRNCGSLRFLAMCAAWRLLWSMR